MLTGKALDVYSGLSSEDTRDYDKLRNDKLRNAKPEKQESPGQLIVRIRTYFNKWVKLSEVEKTFEGMKEMMVQKQFTNSCPRDVSIFRKPRKPKNLEELAQIAE